MRAKAAITRTELNSGVAELDATIIRRQGSESACPRIARREKRLILLPCYTERYAVALPWLAPLSAIASSNACIRAN
jgi:hypothetical protein